MSFKVDILTPTGLFMEKEGVDELYIPSTNGPMGILNGYTPGYFKLKSAGILRVKSNGVTSFFAVFGGFAESQDGNLVKIITHNIEAAENIDAGRAKNAERIARERLEANKDAHSNKLANLKLQRNLIRLTVKELGQGHEKE